MSLRPEYVGAIRALGGIGRDMRPVIRLLRDPSGLPPEDWQELVALLVELLRTGEELRQLAEVSEASGVLRKLSAKPAQFAHVSINPLVLRVHGNGRGRPPKGQDMESTRLRWIAELSQLGTLSEAGGVSCQVDAKPGKHSPLSEIADALESKGRYRLELGQRRPGNVEAPEAGLLSIVICEKVHRGIRYKRTHGAQTQALRRMARERGISIRSMNYHWKIYQGALMTAREELLRILAQKK